MSSQFFTGSVALIGLLVAGVAPAQHLPPAPPIPAMSASAAPDSHKAFAAISLPIALAATPEVLHVSPQGSDDGDGSPAHPFHTLERAQMAVRRLNATHDVIVMPADGTYRLTTPLHFTALDGGQHSHVVRWQASEGAHPVVSGGVAVTGWTVADRARDIWVATVPRGLDPRQLYVGTQLAQRAHVQAPRTAFAFTTTGITIVDPKWHFLASLPDQSRIEVEQTGFFTDRRARVDRISGETLWMQQPGWRNNLIGYDTLARTLAGDKGRLFFANSLAFLREPGTIFHRSRIRQALLQAPRGREYDAVAGRAAPSRDVGLNCGQLRSAGHRPGFCRHCISAHELAGILERRRLREPAERILSGRLDPGLSQRPHPRLQLGCWAFETMRNRWQQQPAAVQVAAATRVTFEQAEFTQLGQIALGIGNNPEANESGVGYGAAAVEVRRSRFAELAGGAIMVGGITPDAHHPPRPEMGSKHHHLGQPYRECIDIEVKGDAWPTGARTVIEQARIEPGK